MLAQRLVSCEPVHDSLTSLITRQLNAMMPSTDSQSSTDSQLSTGFQPSTDSQRSTNPPLVNSRPNEPTFLGIPAEIRNAIYRYAFAADTKRSLALRALTRVNQQIREESKAMEKVENESVDTLVIAVRTRKQLADLKQWLEQEVDAPTYTKTQGEASKLSPQYPDLEFHYTAPKGENIKLCFACEEICPAQELSRLASQGATNKSLSVLISCLGLESSQFLASDLLHLQDILSLQHIHHASLLSKSDVWIVRQVTCEGYSQQGNNPLADYWELEDMYMFFRGRAIENCGAEWDAKFILDKVVRYVESMAVLS